MKHLFFPYLTSHITYPKESVCLWAFCIFILSENAFAQKTDTTQIQIPAEWLGKWIGEMVIYASNGTTQTIVTELHISQNDTSKRWTWKIVYGKDAQRQERNYELVAFNALKGRYLIDEKNSILLEAFFVDNTLNCQFLVFPNMITTTYRLVKKKLYFENLMVRYSQPIYTGKGSPDIPEVLTYPIRVFQRAILRKVK